MLAFASRGLVLAIALVLAGSAAATPAGKEGPRKETPADTLRKALDFGVTLELTDTPLPAVVQQLAEMAKVNLVLDKNVSFTITDQSEMLVSLKARDTKLRTVLHTIASQHGLTFGIVGDHILISSEEVVNHRQLRQRVSLDLNGEVMVKAVKDLAQNTGTNILIDPRSQKAAEGAKVTLQLDDVPLDSAVRLMAELNGLKSVRMGNVLLLTSEERAEKLRAEGEAPTPGPREGVINTPATPLPMMLPTGPEAPPALPVVPPMPTREAPRPVREFGLGVLQRLRLAAASLLGGADIQLAVARSR
jgi:type II secretory pathway component GspD/PulD (secretin)